MNMTDFLAALYKNCEGYQIETRALPSKKQAFHKLGNWSDIEAWCNKNKGQNLYVAVATRNGGGTKGHISQIPALWCDLDFKDVPKDEADRRLREFPLRPSLVVNSGGGFHVYWILKEPLGREDIPRVEAVLRQIQAFLGGDPAATDASRILRLPGTLNYKYDPARLVNVHTCNDFTYTLEDIAGDLLPPRCAGGATSEEHHYNDNDNSYSTYKGACPRGTDSGTEAGQSGTERDIDFSIGHQDVSLFTVAWHLAKSGMTRQNVLKTLTFLARACDANCDFERWASDKTNSAFDRLARKETSLAEEIRAWVRDTSGTFSGQDWDKYAQSGTKRDKAGQRKSEEDPPPPGTRRGY